MSTVAEIKAAVKSLSREQQQEVFAFLAEWIGRPSSDPANGEDAFALLIGAYAGPHEATGRKSEEILYGTEG